MVLDAQDAEDAGRGQREGREREGDPGLEPGREMGRPRIACGTNSAEGKRAVVRVRDKVVQANGYMFLGAANDLRISRGAPFAPSAACAC